MKRKREKCTTLRKESSNAINNNTMQFRENLPEQCPPAEARCPKSGELVYRLGHNSNGYSDDDFLSHWQLNPGKHGSYSTRPGECQAKSLSIFLKEADVIQARKLPTLKRMQSILRIKLDPTDGQLMQTSRPSHHSLWLSCTFDPGKANILVTPL